MSKNEDKSAQVTALVPMGAQQDSRALDRLAFEPSNWTEAMAVAKVLVDSRLLPNAVDTPQKAITIIMKGRELGLTTMQALSSIYVIEGKPTMSADLMAALVISSGKAEYFEMIESSSERCTFATKRRGSKNEQRITWTIDDAKKAGLYDHPKKDIWKKYTAAMLRARTKADLARAVYPEIVAGCYDPDELDGMVIDVGRGAAAPQEPTRYTPPSISERRDKAKEKYNAFEVMLGVDAVFHIVGKTRKELENMTLEDWERAVEHLERAQAVHTGAIAEDDPPPRGGPSLRAVEGPPTEDAQRPGASTTQSPEEAQRSTADGPESRNTPSVAPKTATDTEVTDRDLMKALRNSKIAGMSLAELTRKPEFGGQNPDKLTADERRNVYRYLLSMAKDGGAQ